MQKIHFLIHSVPYFQLQKSCKDNLGWSKTTVPSLTEKLMAETKFSDYIALNHYKKAKKIKHFNHLDLPF
jgi:hypothetical protein